MSTLEESEINDAFGDWLNEVRGARGLGPVEWDPEMDEDARTNSRNGFGHTFMGRARRQNAGSGNRLATICALWLASPPHADALLDASITGYGIAHVGPAWTFSAR